MVKQTQVATKQPNRLGLCFQLIFALLLGQLLVLPNEITTLSIELEKDQELNGSTIELETKLQLAITREEVEAHLEVESILYEITEETSDQNYASFLDRSINYMQTVLENRAESKYKAESSREGEIRGYSNGLMQELIELYQQAALCRLDQLSIGSERVGKRAVLIEKQLEVQLSHLNKYLAALFGATQDGCHKAANQDGNNSNLGRHGGEKEKSWFEKTLDWIG